MMKIYIVGDIWAPDKPSTIAIGENYWNNLFESQCNDIIFIANFEGVIKKQTLTNSNISNKSLYLDVDASLLHIFSDFGLIIFSLANNHVTDRDSEILLHTQQQLERLGFLTVGAGKDITEARRPVQFQVDGVRIAILAYCETKPFVGGIPATADSPGVAPLIPELIEQDIRAARMENDQVWLLPHWGYEYHRYPSPELREWAQRWGAAGASLIFGTHPHNLQGMEKINGTQIFYSIGNFIFPEPMMQYGFPLHFDRRSRQTIAVSVDVQKGDCQIRHFVQAHDGWPRTLSAMANLKAERNLAKLSAKFGENYNSFYRRNAWKDRLLKNLRRLKCIGWREFLHRSIRLGRL